MSNGYIHIVHWDKYQHYKDRTPPWIKVYSKLLNKYEYQCLQDDSKLLLIHLWLWRSVLGGPIPHDITYLNSNLKLCKKITSTQLQALVNAGFIECKQNASTVIAECKQNASTVIADCKQNASTVIADCKQNAIPETETETETDKEKYMDAVFLSRREHAALVEKFGEQGTADRIARLNNYICSKGKRYKSHYHTILMWENKNAGPQRKTAREKIAEYEAQHERA